MKKRILLIVGHPSQDSLCHALAQSYQQGALTSGHDVKYIALGELQFDPTLKEGYKTPQALEPDLVKAQEAIQWAEHLVFAYPIWWGAMPSLLKGFIDRVFLPGFAFKYRKDSVWWDKLLTGRSARLLVTMDTPPWYFKWIYSMPNHHQMRKTILGFCGIAPVKISSFGVVKGSSDAKRNDWIKHACDLGQAAK